MTPARIVPPTRDRIVATGRTLAHREQSWSRLWALPFAFILAACAGVSDSQVPAPDEAGDDSGSSCGTASGSTSGGSGMSASGSSGSSSGSSGGTGDDTGDTEGGATCAAPTSLTQGAHISLSVSWPATLSGDSGSGPVEIWLLSKLTAGAGGTLTGKTRICGVTLPVDALNGAGELVTGGTKVDITLPGTVWNASTMPSFSVTATTSGWNAGSSVKYSPVLTLLGLSVSNPTLTWPSSTWDFPSATAYPDDDGDGKPGITAVPLAGNGYTLPPTGLGAFGSAPTTDKIYIALRSELTLTGHWTSCTAISGTATVTYFDNHVVGCHVNQGADCTTGATNTQADFVDQARTLYAPGAATFVAKTLADTAACPDVLTALPAK